MEISKSLLTNIVAVLFIGLAFVVPKDLYTPMLNIGTYAFSGAITNWLAIYMLFERVPYLYGSGVIEKNFETFKNSVKKMVMEQFFDASHVNKFLSSEEKKIDLAPIIKSTDMSPAFDALKSTVLESKIGGMLGMFGGESLIDSFKDSFLEKLQSSLVSIVSSDEFHAQIHIHFKSSSVQSDLIASIEKLVNSRLEILTPKMVKELVKALVDEHLGWLVVWGGIFGGLIGLVSSFLV
jgi:uncharacterized membrane protein YheB (UPF0754 family)